MSKITILIISFFVIVSLCGCQTMSNSEAEAQGCNAAATAISASKTEEETKKDNDIIQDTDDLSIMGEVIGDRYINEEIGFTAQIPSNWKVASIDAEEEQIQQSNNLQASVNLNFNFTGTNILTCSEFGLDYIQGLNPNISICLQDNTWSSAYLEPMIDGYEKEFTKLEDSWDGTITFSGEESIKINSIEYSVIYTVMDFEDLTIYSDQYYKNVGDQVLTITLTYYDSGSKKIMEDFMQSLEYSS